MRLERLGFRVQGLGFRVGFGDVVERIRLRVVVLSFHCGVGFWMKVPN